MFCYRHPKVETAVSCNKCDRPICPKCMVSGPVGMRCPDCASLRTTALYKIHPARLALAIAAGLITGIVGAYLMEAFNFFVFFVGPIYGGIVAEAVLRASGRKRGRVLEVIGVSSIALGGLLVSAPVIWLLLHPIPILAGAPGTAVGGLGLVSIAWPLLGCGLAASTCYWRLKNL